MDYVEYIGRYPKIKELRSGTHELLSSIRADLPKVCDAEAVMATGSFGREEAHSSSDIDWFFLQPMNEQNEASREKARRISEQLSQFVSKVPGDTGIFGRGYDSEEFLKKIGGMHDTNDSMTIRMLFLLEGTWLYDEDQFLDYRKRLLESYVQPQSGNVPRFLLNDIIRYYRTIATDFENKVNHDDKPWGLRSIKLRFSRKLLYFAGVVAVAESIALDGAEKKVSKINELLAHPPLYRLYDISRDGSSELHEHTDEIFRLYDHFLEVTSNKVSRDELERLEKAQRKDSAVYREISGKSKEFSRALWAWLKTKYGADHKIHEVLVF